MRLFLFFRHCETVQISHFSRNFFSAPPINFSFDILQQNGCSKNPKGSPPFTFFGTMRLTGDFKKKFEKKLGKFFSSIFSFLRTFVVSSCRKSDFRVLLSLRYAPTWAVPGLFVFFSKIFCADFGRSRLVHVCEGTGKTKGSSAIGFLSVLNFFLFFKTKIPL